MQLLAEAVACVAKSRSFALLANYGGEVGATSSESNSIICIGNLISIMPVSLMLPGGASGSSIIVAGVIKATYNINAAQA